MHSMKLLVTGIKLYRQFGHWSSVIFVNKNENENGENEKITNSLTKTKTKTKK